MEKVASATLRYLFQEYLKGPTVPYSINKIVGVYNADPVLVSSYMLERKWIRERWIYQDELVTCRITVEGIEEVNPSYLNIKLRKIVGGVAEAGGKKSLMDIFQNDIAEYSIAFDIVNQLEKLNLITMVHHKGNIMVELTNYGWRFFEKNGSRLFTLVVA